MRMNKRPGQQKLAEALRIANGMIERAVTEAFNHLDAATHSVEIRKQLHAIFVQRAIELAEIRFPENGALRSALRRTGRSEEHTSELQSLMRISYAVFCLKKQNQYKYLISIIHVSKQHKKY